MFSKKNKNRNVSSIERFFGLSFSSILIIGAFVFSPLTAARAAGVSLSATPTSRTVNQGQAATYTININRDNYTGSVTLSASNLPANATAAFNPNPTTGKSSVLTVTTKTTTPTGTFQIKVAGAGVGISIAPINVTLIVNPAPSVTLTAVPTVQSIIAGQATDYQIRLARTNYDGPVTLTANLPSGLSASFEPNPVSGNSSTMRIYSHLLPFLARDYDIIVSSREFLKPITVKVRVNCDIGWAEQFGWIDPIIANNLDVAKDVAVANDGSIYVAGQSYNLNDGTLDVWVAKYNSGGGQQWFTPFRSNGSERASKVAVDGSGNVFAGGYTDGTFPGNSSGGNQDFWIAKFDSQGVQQWVKQSNLAGEDGTAGFVIIPDGAGGGKLITSTNDKNRISTFTFASNNGTLTQQNSFPLVIDYNFQDFDITDIAAGPNDTVYVVGNLQFPTFPLTQSSWIVKYDNTANRNNRFWSQTIGFGTADSATRVITDSSGSLYVSGSFNDAATGVDAWIAKFNADNPNSNRVDTNPPVWTAFEKSSAEDDINALAFNNDGDLITAGKTQGVLGESNGGGFDAWVARRDSANGNLKWVRQFPRTDNDSFNAAAVASGSNDLILAGETIFFKSNIADVDALLLHYNDGWTLLSPVINSANPFNPSSARVGATVRINGTNFSGINGVRFNGVPAQFTVVNSNAIDAIVPPGATTGVVAVIKGCNSTVSTAQFTVLP